MDKLSGSAPLPVARRPFVVGALGALSILGAGQAASLSSRAIAQSASSPKLRAFIVGVDQYDQLDQLKRAVADATQVAQAVDACGYDVTLVENADHAAIMASFDAFLESFEAGDAAFLYFAGHGIQIAGEGFLLPKNADCGAQTQFEETSIALGYLFDELHFKEPSQTIAVIDACRNPLASVDLPNSSVGMANFAAPDGFCVLFAAGQGQYALDSLSTDDQSGNGLFARYLVPNLTLSASAESLYYGTRDKVIEAAARVPHLQVPAFYNQAGRLQLVPGFDPGQSGPAHTDEIKKCGVILIQSSVGGLRAPPLDVAALREHFESFGAEVELVANPDARELRLACVEFAKRDFDRIVFYWSGNGGIILDDGMVQVSPVKGGHPEEGRPVDLGWDAPSQMVLLQDIYRFLRPEGSDTAKSTTPIFMFIDTCASDWGYAVSSPETDSLLERLRRSEITDVSVLYAGSLGQVSLDMYASGLGALATGMLAAFRPGHSLGEIASDIRQIVQNLDLDTHLSRFNESEIQDFRKELPRKADFYDGVKALSGLIPGQSKKRLRLQCPQLFASWEMANSVPLPLI